MVFIFLSYFSAQLYGDFIYRIDLTSRYIWRGFDLNPNKQPVLQPSFEYSCGDCGITLNLWSSFSFNDTNNHEIDLSFTYDFNISDHFSLAAGIIHYGWYFVEHFSFSQNTTQEIFLTAAFPNLFFHPGFTIFYDFGNGDGFYLLLEMVIPQKFSSSVEFNFYASLGYNGGQWLADKADPGFSDLNLGFDCLLKIKRFILSPFIRYTVVLLKDLGDQNHFWFGISMRYH